MSHSPKHPLDYHKVAKVWLLKELKVLPPTLVTPNDEGGVLVTETGPFVVKWKTMHRASWPPGVRSSSSLCRDSSPFCFTLA